MKRIHHISDISTLGLSKRLSTELMAHLESGFDSPYEAEQFWSDYDTFLTFIEPCDTELELQTVDKQEGYWMDFIINNLEFVLLLDAQEPYLLALAIIDDAGAGIYLLLPLSHQSLYSTTLINHLNNQ